MSQTGKERRRLKRTASRIPARFESAGLRGQAHIKNLHKDGLFLRSNLLPRKGAEVRISFETSDGQKLEVAGTVRWTTEEYGPVPEGSSGFGVLIAAPTPAYLEFFESVLLQ